MADFSELIARIKAAIKPNGQGQITGQVMQDALVETGAGIVQEVDAKKQDTLVSGETIKTINGSDILGEGDLIIAEPVVGRVVIDCDEEGNLGILVASIDWEAVAAKHMYAVVVEWDESVADYYNDGNYVLPVVLSLSDGTNDNDVPVLNFRGNVSFDTYVYDTDYILTLTADAVNAECSATFSRTIEREMEEALAGKADASDVYTKTQMDTLLAGKVSSTDVTSIVRVNALPQNPDANTLYIV